MSTDTTVSPLRQRMIEDMAARKLGPHSQRSHIHSFKRFAAFLERSPVRRPPTTFAASSCIWRRPTSVSAIATGS
jgi:hypothetical protein